MVVVSSHGALTQRGDALFALQRLGADEPDHVGHEGALVLGHDLRVVVTVELGATEAVQRLKIVIQDLHLVGPAVLDSQHRRHVVDDVVEARAEVEGRPVQEPDAAVGCHVHVAHVRVSVQQSPEPRVSLSVVAIQGLVAPSSIHEVLGQLGPAWLSHHIVPRRAHELHCRVVVVPDPCRLVRHQLPGQTGGRGGPDRIGAGGRGDGNLHLQGWSS